MKKKIKTIILINKNKKFLIKSLERKKKINLKNNLFFLKKVNFSLKKNK